MRLAVHTQTLQDMFSSSCDPLMTNAVLASHISVTPAILNQYHLALGSNASFQAWFASLMAANRFSVHLPQAAPARVQTSDGSSDGFGTASYFGASTLVAESHNLPVGGVAALDSIGVNLISAKSKFSGTLPGDNPFLTIAVHAGRSDGFGVFDRFIKSEDNVVIYDKYINAASVELIEYLAANLSPGSSIKIFHSSKTGKHLLSSADVVRRVHAANTTIVVTCKVCPPAFTSTEHDRYIFLGKRIQVVFTVGLDCFGAADPATGKRTNRNSKIMFFEVTTEDQLDIQALDGSVCRVNHLTNLPQV